MQICVGVPSEKLYLPPIPASVFPDCTCFHCVAYFPAHRQRGTWLALVRARRGARPPSVAGCWVDQVVGTSKQKLVDEGV